MNPKLLPIAHHMVQANEGFRSKKYQDTKGYWTIGFGHNLDASKKRFETLSLPEGEDLFLLDFAKHQNQAESIPQYAVLDDIRKIVLIDMVFQMGKGGVIQFKKTLNYIQDENFERASLELLDSKYAKVDAPQRAKRNAKLLRSGFLFDISLRNIAGLTQEENQRKCKTINEVMLK